MFLLEVTPNDARKTRDSFSRLSVSSPQTKTIQVGGAVTCYCLDQSAQRLRFELSAADDNNLLSSPVCEPTSTKTAFGTSSVTAIIR